MIALYNRQGLCLLRGTEWLFEYSSVSLRILSRLFFSYLKINKRNCRPKIHVVYKKLPTMCRYRHKHNKYFYVYRFSQRCSYFLPPCWISAASSRDCCPLKMIQLRRFEASCTNYSMMTPPRLRKAASSNIHHYGTQYGQICPLKWVQHSSYIIACFRIQTLG